MLADFYSDSCGPCRMMAPIFRQVASKYADRAVFVKIDTNAQHSLSSQYQIRSLPTFLAIVGGKVIQTQLGGIGEQGLVSMVDAAIRQAELDNVVLQFDDLVTYYQSVEPTKPKSDIETVFRKCASMVKTSPRNNPQDATCSGAAANQLVRRLRQKYKKVPPTVPRFTDDDRKAKNGNAGSGSGSGSKGPTQQQQRRTPTSSPSTPSQPNLQAATLEQLQEELARRLDEERDRQVDAEDEDDDEADPDYRRWTPGTFPEKLVVVGGGPAGMAAALYGARAGLQPLVLAPSMGGQLLAKGVDVENYPGVNQSTGPGLVAAMRKQAAHFGAIFEDDVVMRIDASSRPFRLITNATGVVETHAVVVATGAEARWLNIPGEYELRGAGVSSCATCDGFLFANHDVVVVGGGDAAMEDALVLARTSRRVTLVHRRDAFRASKVLADRVLRHPDIRVIWNATVQEILGRELPHASNNADAEEEDLDAPRPRVVTGAVLKDVATGEITRLDCDAVFVAIGHTPATAFLQGVVEFDPHHPGYLWTNRQAPHFQTQTSIQGIFAAGDVADAVYRQAVTSAGSGAAAALDAERYLSEAGLGNEEADLEAELLAELMADSASRASQASDGYNVYTEAGGRGHGVKESLAAEL